MKKIFLTFVLPFAFYGTLQAQISQDASDSIVLARMSLEMRQHTVYAKMDSAAISTKAGELLEMYYPCQVYYIKYADQADTVPDARRYLVVTESSGNVLEVRTKNDVAPPDLAVWRKVPADPYYPTEVPFTEYALENSCQLANLNNDTIIVINSNEELENYVICTDSTYLPIDFTQNSLLLVYGTINKYVYSTAAVNINAVSFNQYELNTKMYLCYGYEDTAQIPQEWSLALIVPKLSQNANFILNMIVDTIEHEPKVLMLEVNYLYYTFMGGKEFVFSNNSNSFTITCEKHFSESSLKLFYQEIGELLFFGTIMRMGEGYTIFPNDMLHPNQFQKDTNHYVYPQNGFEIVFDDYDIASNDYWHFANGLVFDMDLAWDAVQSLEIVREYLRYNPNQKVKIAMYTRCIGAVNPVTSSWLIFLKK